MCSIQYNSRVNRRKVLLAAVISACCQCFLSQPGFAQQEFLSTPAPASASPARWVSGPATASLGNTAEIAIPEGCRFTDQNGARYVLASSQQPVPDNLMGLLFPESRKWYAVIQFTDIGYVKDADRASLDADAILKKYQGDVARQNRQRSGPAARAAVTDISWELKPSYDPVLNKLEYALKAKGAVGGSINYVLNCLGRRGMLSVTIVQSDQAGFNPAALRAAIKGIVFKNGERYADFQPSDRVARFGVADLILNSDGAEPLSRWERLAQNKWIWAGAATVLLLGGSGLTILIRRKYKAHYYRMDEKPRRTPAVAAQPSATNGHAVNGNGKPQIELANAQASIRPNGGFQRNGHRRRKKRFSYHAFYSDMVMNLTRCNYVGSPSLSLAGRSTNNLEVPLPPQTQDLNHNSTSSDAASILVAETSKLIQSQQKLIEGQRRLIEEQSKLIQEKSMLIGGEMKAAAKEQQPVAEQQLI